MTNDMFYKLSRRNSACACVRHLTAMSLFIVNMLLVYINTHISHIFMLHFQHKFQIKVFRTDTIHHTNASEKLQGHYTAVHVICSKYI